MTAATAPTDARPLSGRKPAHRAVAVAGRLAAVAALAVAAGCSALPGDDLGLVAGAPPAATSRAVPTIGAWAALPAAAGPVLSVVETATPRRTSQRIVLGGAHDGPGENAVTVSRSGPAGTDPALLAAPTEAEFAAAAAAAVPGVALRRVPVVERNGFGPFVHAVGRVGGTTCVFALQRTADRVPGLGGLASRSDPVEVRVRLCRRADEATLVALLRGLARPAGDALAGLTPAGDALAATDALALAAPGAAMVVAPAVLADGDDGAAPATAPARRIRTAAPPALAPQSEEIPAIPAPAMASVGGATARPSPAAPSQPAAPAASAAASVIIPAPSTQPPASATAPAALPAAPAAVPLIPPPSGGAAALVPLLPSPAVPAPT